VETAGFAPITATSLVEESHRQIKAQILSGELAAGEPLKDSVLAQKMGVSRSPVREALRLLEQTGLVQKSNNRSYLVADISKQEDLEELALLRLADEGLAVQVIVERRLAIDTLEPALEAIRARGADPVASAQADTDFHTAVVALAGLPRLTARYAGLTDQIRLMLITSSASNMMQLPMLWENHRALYDALATAVETGDPGPALATWRQHILAPVVSSRASG
jgi:DNA-binding GntR family transcriptional regulator